MDAVSYFNSKNKATLREKRDKLGGYNIHYVVGGKGNPIVLLHSAAMGWFQWSEIMPFLMKDFTVYALDFPGYGSSSHFPNLSDINLSKLYPTILKEFITKYRLKGCFVLAHSLGSWIALRVKLDNRDLISKVIVESPFGLTKDLPRSQKMATNKYLVMLLKNSLFKSNTNGLRRFLMNSMYLKKKLPEQYVIYMQDCIAHGALHPLDVVQALSQNGLVKDEFVVSKLELCKLSDAYFLAGDKDPFINANTLERLRKLENIKIRVFKNAGHVPSIEVPYQYKNAIISILR